MKALILAAALAGAALPAGAASLGDRFTGYVALGDSLSDPGNLHAATGGLFPPRPYVDGHFSDGPTFTEYLAAEFDPADVTNYATGYARAVDPGYPVPSAPPGVAPLIAHLPKQLALYMADASGGGAAGALVTVLFGANDLFNIPLEVAPDQRAGAIVLAARSVIGAVQAIAATGPAQILVSNLPDLGQIPAALAQGPVARAAATAATDLFNAVLAQGIAGLAAPRGTEIALYDFNAAFDSFLDDPAGSGFVSTAIPCFFVTFLGDCTGFLFADPVHPTTAAHALIAAGMREEIMAGDHAVVPLPAALPLLLAGLGGLGLVARRGRRAA